MKLSHRLLSAGSAASTFALNFWPWLVGAFLLGASAGAFPAYKIARAFYRGEALDARLQLSKFTEAQATQAADTQRQVRDLVLEREREAAARDGRISAMVAAIPSEVARQLQPELLAFRSAINANPDLACLNLPLPDSALGVLSRPGGSITTGDR